MKTTAVKSEYDLQAEAFASEHNTTMATLYLGHFPRFDEYATSQWQITLTRPGHGNPFAFTFSQSINESWRHSNTSKGVFVKPSKGLPRKHTKASWPKTGEAQTIGRYRVEPVEVAPKLYDILACLTKSNPGYFEEFCSEYGYSDDSIKARDTWQEVVKEWREVERLFGDCLDELQEIN